MPQPAYRPLSSATNSGFNSPPHHIPILPTLRGHKHSSYPLKRTTTYRSPTASSSPSHGPLETQQFSGPPLLNLTPQPSFYKLTALCSKPSDGFSWVMGRANKLRASSPTQTACYEAPTKYNPLFVSAGPSREGD
ncbi:hypothetical protein K440DRAFT_643970 [Wilcoxina mikolae CBS 423.85]|nr:hypothetical protein K440DRAFT_643970 [Wilcoxina mikolae CBS 423.85]